MTLTATTISLGQRCQVTFWELTQALSACCDFGDPMPDEHGTISIFWDRNGNGPDETDSLAPIGTNRGEWNYNTFPMNGESQGWPGMFTTLVPFTSVDTCFSPRRFFLRVRRGPAQWQSAIVNVDTGSGIYECDGWVCSDLVVDSQVYRFAGTPVRAFCLTVCSVMPLTIEVPNCDALHIPRVRVEAGCNHLPVCNYPERTPAVLPFEGFLPNEAWTRIDDVWYANVAITSSGAICLTWQECSDLAVSDDKNELVSDFSLSQNFPNPFNPTTEITFSLPKETEITLRVFDVLGREVATLVDRVLPAGEHGVKFEGTELAAGIYFYRLTASGRSETRKMVMLK